MKGGRILVYWNRGLKLVLFWREGGMIGRVGLWMLLVVNGVIRRGGMFAWIWGGCLGRSLSFLKKLFSFPLNCYYGYC